MVNGATPTYVLCKRRYLNLYIEWTMGNDVISTDGLRQLYLVKCNLNCMESKGFRYAVSPSCINLCMRSANIRTMYNSSKKKKFRWTQSSISVNCSLNLGDNFSELYLRIKTRKYQMVPKHSVSIYHVFYETERYQQITFSWDLIRAIR